MDQELADVVIAAKTADQPFRPWYVTLRAWLFCLAFLLLAELATRAYFDTTLCLHGERFDNYPTPALENAFVAQMRRDKAYKVVMIGDSTIVGSALLDNSQTISHFLEEDLRGALPGRDIHVWNLSLAGLRSSDVLSLLLKALEGKPDFVVIEGNYYIVSAGGPPIAEPWLADNLPAVPAAIKPLLPKRGDKKRLEDNLTASVEEASRFIGLRQAINAMLFGVQPRVPWGIPNPLVMTGVHAGKKLGKIRMQPWYEKGAKFQPTSYLVGYKNDIAPDNRNMRYYGDILTELQRSGLPCMTYLTPQNPAITTLLPERTYRANRQALSQSMARPGIPNHDYSDLIPSELFTDNDHMMVEGNRRVATALAQEVAPRIHSAISDGQPPRPVASGR